MELERRGVATVLLADEPFLVAANAQAQMLGHAELPIVSVGGRILALNRDAMHARIDGVIDEIVGALCGA
ncbi:MAG: hypothetical protein HY329_08585 [Chloroflexi bacterium]|nr:hypothetical protein [Chloroflexota bacterium]